MPPRMPIRGPVARPQLRAPTPGGQPMGPNALEIARNHMVNGGGDDPALVRQRAIDEMIRANINAQPYTYYDTFLISAYQPKGYQVGQNVNFGAIVTPITLFNGNTINKNGYAITSMTTQNGQMDVDFLCTEICVDTFCSSNANDAGQGFATSQAFVESFVNSCALVIEFGKDPILIRKLIELPSGGGVYADSRVKNVGFPIFVDQANVNNGFPGRQAAKMLEEPIAFKQTDTFALTLQVATDAAGTGGPLGFLNALPALTGNQTAGVCVRLAGIRGKDLLRGTPTP